MSETSETEVLSESESQETIQKTKPKRERTDKQKEHFARLSELNKKRHEEKRLQKEEEEAQRKKELEKKVIEKAIKIKKKQIKKEKILEELSDDDTPIQKLPVKRNGLAESRLSSEPPKYVSKFKYIR